MIYRFRIILDHKDDSDIFRDIALKQTDSFEDFHNAIVQAFGFEGNEMASFYVSNDLWEQGEEISLFDIGENESISKSMSATNLEDIVDATQNKLLYVYDFLNLWTFFVELAEIVTEIEGADYPKLLYAHGQMPESAPEKDFEANDQIGSNGFDDDMNEDSYDEDDLNDFDSNNDWY